LIAYFLPSLISSICGSEEIVLAIKEIDKAFARIPTDRDVIIAADILGGKDSGIDPRIAAHVNKKISELRSTNTPRSGHEYVAPKGNASLNDKLSDLNGEVTDISVDDFAKAKVAIAHEKIKKEIVVSMKGIMSKEDAARLADEIIKDC